MSYREGIIVYKRVGILIAVLVLGANASENPFDIKKNIQKVEKEESLLLKALEKEQAAIEKENDLLLDEEDQELLLDKDVAGKLETQTTTKVPAANQLPPEVETIDEAPTQKVYEEIKESKTEDVSPLESNISVLISPEEVTASPIIADVNKSMESDISQEIDTSEEETQAEPIPPEEETIPREEIEIEVEKPKEMYISEANVSIVSETEKTLAEPITEEINNQAENNNTQEATEKGETSPEEVQQTIVVPKPKNIRKPKPKVKKKVNVKKKTKKKTKKNVSSNRHGSKYYRSYRGKSIVSFSAGLPVGSIVTASTMPRSCKRVIVSGIRYRQCGSSYYQPHYKGDTVVYQVVNSPH